MMVSINRGLSPFMLVAQRLPAIALGFHARADYLERRGVPATLADLAGHDMIGFDAETPALRAMLAHPFIVVAPVQHKPAAEAVKWQIRQVFRSIDVYP